MHMPEHKIIEQNNTQLSNQMTQFEELLISMGLPSENIIASIEERENIMSMLPSLIQKLPSEQKRNATYLSRFVAGSAIGLFDAALNYVWDEVVVNLRRKITYYGIDIFFDNAVGAKVRDQYKSEEDLAGIKDKTMLETCKKLEWISDIVYRKLCHILDTRNQIGASHPNTYTINSYELLGWLQTCVTEVINDKPSPSAIQVRTLIENIKINTEPLDLTTIHSFESAVKELSSSMASNLLTSLFGLYISNSTSNEVRNNILSLSKIIWKYCKSETKYDLGEKKELYRVNLDKAKEDLAYTFFEKCDGLSYLSLTERSLQLSTLCDDLLNAHNSWDNFYHEPPIAKDIMKYIKTSNDIPTERTEKLIRTFTECRIGREVTYCHGVSQGALSTYNDFFKLLSKEHILILLTILKDEFDSIYNGAGIRAQNARELILCVKSPILGDRINEILDFMLNFSDRKILNKVYKDQSFKELCNGILDIYP